MASGTIQASGERLFAAFRQTVPLPEEFFKGKKKKDAAKEIPLCVEAGLTRFYAAALAERKEQNLSFIARARVAFDLQRRLLAAGYAPPLVKQVLFAMLTSAFVGRE